MPTGDHKDWVVTVLNRPTSGQKLHNKKYYGNDQQDVDQAADSLAGKTKSKCPKYQKDNNNCPKHSFPSLIREHLSECIESIYVPSHCIYIKQVAYPFMPAGSSY